MASQSIQRAGAKIFYELRGSGPAVFLLHPFPTNHHFWDSISPSLELKYRLIVPDLRGHGESPAGEGASMANHAEDLFQICRDNGIKQAAFVGVSIGGYALFEFWRRHRELVAMLVLSNTKAMPDARNRGYGDAVRSGIAAARMPWILLTDADLQFDLAELEDFLPLAARADIVVGWRILRRTRSTAGSTRPPGTGSCAACSACRCATSTARSSSCAATCSSALDARRRPAR